MRNEQARANDIGFGLQEEKVSLLYFSKLWVLAKSLVLTQSSIIKKDNARVERNKWFVLPQ